MSITNVQASVTVAVETMITPTYRPPAPAELPMYSVFGHVAPSGRLVKQPGEWNKMTIEARGHQLKVWLNGTLASEMDMTKWTSVKTNPDGSQIPAWLTIPLANVPTKGRIGFQGKHGEAAIWFRNIQIKQLAK